MTPLATDLITRIRQTGPITVAQYMAECLTHPVHGYYTRRDPLGAAGDFTTAPEISQMFGELIGLCLAETWTQQGCPDPFVLAELGPGRGTLMADALRATRSVPGFHEAMTLVLVEISPTLRAAQSEHLVGYAPRWLDGIPELAASDAPVFAVANEFFDALPVRQFLHEGQGWRERVVGVDDKNALTFGLSPALSPPDLAHRLEDTAQGDLVEHGDPAIICAATLGRLIADRGGAALIVDYGDWRSLGDTLQAISSHQSVSPLEAPGETDLTVHVDFEALAKAATTAGARHSRVTPQGVFLERLGITPRAQSLARNLAGEALDAHIAAHRRLTHPEEMGNLFKAMAIYPKDAAPPPGLEP